MHNYDRYFKCYDANKECYFGRYCGKTPKQAGSKCATKLYQKQMGNVQNPISFIIKEITRNSKKKIYKYEATRINYAQPIYVNVGNAFNDIIYHHQIKIKRIFGPMTNPDDKDKENKNEMEDRLEENKIVEC